ncbi:DoxX family membrane protein [Haloarcula pellucida]|uniref:DoxX family protein n=1 Tax=Haloarcula pellucida TaxID=1427151 RepID=A0A830GGV9_9EURY|nr:DoxX family membrane protein [Halomicroarcula pellucida]MBX0347000.1 DoxX family membrane protein [Halomicroarcula pellucida]GGN86485.1 DoxX family protein [Halomicroarcula pellucida]
MAAARASALVERLDPDAVARVGLGAMLVLAGVHKLLAPDVWAAYVVDWLAPLLLVTPVQFMLLNGVLEIGFGAVLVADRYTSAAAAVAAVSLAATAAYLAVVGVTEGGLFVDVMIRDVGLTALASAVLVRSLAPSS